MIKIVKNLRQNVESKFSLILFSYQKENLIKIINTIMNFILNISILTTYLDIFKLYHYLL